MAQEWIDSIAQQIKEKNREAAEDYGRSEHYAGIIADKGKPFFMSLVQQLQQNVDGLRSCLQGDATAADTTVETVRACEVKLTRSRFPWVDARVEHHGENITLDYAKTAGAKPAGTNGGATMDRKTCTYAFRVSPDDTLYVEEAFAAEPGQYTQPEELARRITEILFAP